MIMCHIYVAARTLHYRYITAHKAVKLISDKIDLIIS